LIVLLQILITNLSLFSYLPAYNSGIEYQEVTSGCSLTGRLLLPQVTLTDYEEPVLRILRASVAANASCAAANISHPLIVKAATEKSYEVTA
jgi:hypothetical protein